MFIKPIKPTINREAEEQVNEKITYKEVLVIDNNGEQLGIMSKNDALKAAFSRELDLVIVAAQSKPPVAKILDYSKFRFDQQKKSKEIKKNQKITQVKEIRLSPTIQKHDLETKIRAARKFIEGEDKVKISIRFIGRMIVHADLGKKLLNDFIAELADISSADYQPKMEGKILHVVLAPRNEK